VRLQLLEQVALARVKQLNTTKEDNVMARVIAPLREALTEKLVQSVFDGLTGFTKDYDSPARRQELLAQYADQKYAGKRRDKTPRSPRFAATVRQGPGGTLLSADSDGVEALSAVSARKIDDARRHIGTLLPAAATSLHLNYPLGVWFNSQSQSGAAEQRAAEWLSSGRAPSFAYLWRASYQVARKEYTGAMTTLETGEKQVGSPAPFLPHLVSLARAAGQKARAERYAVQCADEDRKSSTNVMRSLVTGGAVPTGLYADCVRRLGYEPPGAENAVMHAFKHPIDSGKSVGSKLHDAFSSKPGANKQ
jgi:hypothetical protein